MYVELEPLLAEVEKAIGPGHRHWTSEATITMSAEAANSTTSSSAPSVASIDSIDWHGPVKQQLTTLIPARERKGS